MFKNSISPKNIVGKWKQNIQAFITNSERAKRAGICFLKKTFLGYFWQNCYTHLTFGQSLADPFHCLGKNQDPQRKGVLQVSNDKSLINHYVSLCFLFNIPIRILHDPQKVNWNLKLNFIECPIIKHLILSPDSLWRFCPWTVCEDFVPGLFVKNVDNS